MGGESEGGGTKFLKDFLKESKRTVCRFLGISGSYVPLIFAPSPTVFNTLCNSQIAKIRRRCIHVLGSGVIEVLEHKFTATNSVFC